jgi:tetratricopeptide (TPR) repeat protein
MKRDARMLSARGRLLWAGLFPALLLACQADAPDGAPEAGLTPAGAEAPLPEGAQARSFLGEVFFPPPLDGDLRASREADLADARTELAADSTDPERWIWVGRRQAYLGQYREAIETFSQGMERFPDDARFHRHRGHRHLTVRQPEQAVADFRRGLELREGMADAVEPDGLPNPLGIPLSTLHFNLWYHLGLAHWVQGEWEDAARAWEACMTVSTNPDLRVATSYWLYQALHRLGREADAEALLVELPAGDEVIENDSYLTLLRLFRGDEEADALLATGDPTSLGGATVGYGVGIHLLLQGREDEARATLQRVLEAPEQWPAFGYLAAEAEVARQGW